MARSKKVKPKTATPQAEPTWWAKLPSTTQLALKWLAGILAAAAATVLAGLLTGAVQHLFTPQEAEPAKPRLPFTTTAEAATYSCDHFWVPRAPSDIQFEKSMIVDPPDFGSYEMAKGGAPASPSSVTLTVQGRTETAVVLTDIDVKIVKKRQVPSGTILHDACGDAGAFRAMNVELDASPPRVTPWFEESTLDLYREDVPPAERRPIRFPYQIRASAPETFLIRAVSTGCDCDWVVVLSWQSGGEGGREVIDNKGEPFRTVSQEQSTHMCSSYGECNSVKP